METFRIVYADDVAVLKMDETPRLVTGTQEDIDRGKFIKKHIESIVPMRVGDLDIGTKHTAKYLGLMHIKLTFGDTPLAQSSARPMGRCISSCFRILHCICVSEPAIMVIASAISVIF